MKRVIVFSAKEVLEVGARVTVRQISAVLVILALMLPVSAPIPAWAYELDLPPVQNVSSVLTVPEKSEVTLFASGSRFLERAVEMLWSADARDDFNSSDSEPTVRAKELEDRVKEVEVLTSESIEFTLGQTSQLSALPLDENAAVVHGIVPRWRSNDTTVMRVVDGSAVAVGTGETTLVVTAEAASKTVSVRITEALEITDSGTTVREGGEAKTTTPSAALVEPTDREVRDSTYTPENNLGSPAGKTEMDSPNTTAALRIRHRAGIANFGFGVPFASLPGRGIDAAIGMNYNSRVWNKTGEGVSAGYQFNVDNNWLAPGFTVGYGKLKSRFESKIVLTTSNQYKAFNEVVPEGFTDSDGLRRPIECKAFAPIPNTQSQGGTNTYCSEYGTADGSFVKVSYHGDRPLSGSSWPPSHDMSAYASTFFTLTYTDGTKVTYSAPGAQFAADEFAREHYPVRIQDGNGNQIDIAYKDGKDNVEYIRDTLGRYIRFFYETGAEKKLVAVTVPGLSGGPDRQTIRFYYDENVPLAYQGRFTGYPAGPSTFRALRYIYFPATGFGYKYDYHPNFGMITRISKLTGMTVAGNSLTSTGSVNAGFTVAATTEYLYPNDGSQTPLTDVPKYTQRTDDWLGRTSLAASITRYDAPEPATGQDQVSEVTVPDTEFDVEYRTVAHNTTDWKNGLIKETTVTKLYGPDRQFSAPVSRTVYTWDQGVPDFGGRRMPILVKVETTNDALQTRAMTFAYDGYNNQTVAREHDFAEPGSEGAELRRTEIAYETGSSWISNNLIRLPKEIKSIVNGATVSKVVYEYDNYVAGMASTPGVIQHNPGYDTNSGTHQCNPHYECPPGDNPPNCPMEYDDCPNYDPAAMFRGNVTKITSFSDASLASDPNASVRTMKYDITGNVVEASMSCCNVKTLEYSAATHYAYVTRETKGAAPTQLVNTVAYDFNTGLVRSTTDENNQTVSSTYDPVTLRQTRVDYPNGAWTTADYNDSIFPYWVKSTSSLDAGRSVSSWSFFNGAGQGFRSRSQTANGYLSSDIEFDKMGRAVKTFNPYTVANLGDVRPEGIKSTEVVQFDALGRALRTRFPDDSTVSLAYNNRDDTPANLSRTFVTVTDQAGKKRRQLADALGRIVRVDEPGTDGDLGPVTSPVQPTSYEYDGNDNLTKVTQAIPGGVTQDRVFVYDSLSRLIRERQVEATPTLDAGGNKGAADPGKWTGVYKYTPDGLLDYGVDARGVKTDFLYDGLNRVKEVEYLGETGYTTPKVIYTYSETRNDASGQPYRNNGRLTTVETLENLAQGTPKTIQRYDYDSVGQVRRHRQTIGVNEYELEYGYNLAGQLTSKKYPSGKVVTMTIDNFGVTQSIADSQRTYLSGVTATYDANGVTSEVALGNGTSETFRLNERFQLMSQSLKRGTEVLQKFDYAYGQMNDAGEITPNSNNGQLAKIEAFIGAAKQRTQKFSYDSIGRLAQSEEYRGDTNALTYKQVFDYDRFGNLYRKLGRNPTTGQQNPLPFTPIEEATTPGTGDIDKATNRFRSATGTTYDEAGQVVQDNKFRGMGFSYDANGRVVKVTKANTPDATTVYDALGNRVATKINDVWQYMIYDAFGQLVAEYGVLSAGGSGCSPASGSNVCVQYVQQDHQGSVRTVMNNSGFVVSRTDHQAFGETIQSGVGLRTAAQGYGSPSPTRQGYGLTENDAASGQQHTWFRKLETQAGRWGSPDPYNGSMSLGDPQSFNRYSYVRSEPTNFVDPSGLATTICTIYGGELQCYTQRWGETNAGEGWSNLRYRYREWRLHLGDGKYGRERFWFDYFAGYVGRGRTPPDSDCGRFVEIVERIAKSAKNAKDFADEMAKRFLGVERASTSELRRANEVGSSEFGSSGFKKQFQGRGNQVRHFTAGLIAGYLWGATGGDWGMWFREDDPEDIALNSVSTALGSTIVNPTPATTREIGGGYRAEMRRTVNVPANPGYTDLADRIRKQVCE